MTREQTTAKQHGASLLRSAYPRALSRVLAFTRNLPDAEDAVQEAALRALHTWPERGVPASPEAWLVTVAQNAYRDRLRKIGREQPLPGMTDGAHEDALETLSQMSPWAQAAIGHATAMRGWKDELLRLTFTCCHPALSAGESAALCLATVMGLSTREVALSFTVPLRTIEQRLARARKRLRARGNAEGQPPERSAERLPAVLHVIHLLYNEGYWSSDAEQPIRAQLCRLALGLSHALLDTFTHDAEVAGLAALLTLHEARRRARRGPDGQVVPLPEQDRSQWDTADIAQGTALLVHARTVGATGPYQLEAAISLVHCRAARAEDTDWETIAGLYAELECLRPTPAVRINRAFALGQARDAAVGLALLDDPSSNAAQDYPYAAVVRAELLLLLGERERARQLLRDQLAQARNAAERAQLRRRLGQLEQPAEAEHDASPIGASSSDATARRQVDDCTADAPNSGKHG